MSKQKLSFADELEKSAFEFFNDAIPFYHSHLDDVPIEIKFFMFMNGYTSIPIALHDVAYHQLRTQSVAKYCQRELHKTEVAR